MANSRVHISATEAHTLCGLPASGPRVKHSPWADWIDTYRGLPKATCTACRRAALQYADMSIAIRFADQEYRLAQNRDTY